MRQLHISILSDCIRQLDQKLLSRLSAVPALAARVQSGQLVLQRDTIHADTDIILGDPARILSALQQADREAAAAAANADSEGGRPSLSRLQWVQSTFAGVNAVVQHHSRKDYVLTRTCGFGPQMAEYCMGWALFVQQQMAMAQQLQKDKVWESAPFTHRGSLYGKTIGILGVGDIGSAVAYGARAFHMKTLGLCSSIRSAETNSDQNFDQVTASLPEVLQQCDVLVNTLPSTPRTTGLLTLSVLQEAASARMSSSPLPPKAPPLFINIGRGDIITTADLISALGEEGKERCLSHAVLDVVEQEPLPPSSTLWTHPRVSITPHISAISTPELVVGVFLDNLERFLQQEQGGGPQPLPVAHLAWRLKYVVDRDKGY